MIQRQRRHHHLLSALQQRPIGRFGLLQIGLHVTVREHRALGDARGTAGILQEGQIVVDDVRLDVLHASPTLQHPTERDGVRQVIFGYQALDVLDHEVNQRPLGRR